MYSKDAEGRDAGAIMDVDCSPTLQVILKRSSSAPMINEISTAMSVTTPPTSTPPRDGASPFNAFSSLPRARRFSTSSPGNGGNIGPKLTPRVNQLRQEECIDAVACREVAHEKEIHSAMQISQSWEDLTLDAEGLSFKDCRTESPPPLMATDGMTSQAMSKMGQFVVKKIFDPLSLNLSSPGPPLCSSPSPTRSGLGQRQCYSPLQMVSWKNGSSSPSPTRKAFATRRSLSPVAIRPSCLSGTGIPLKRKFELDSSTLLMDPTRCSQPPAKRNFIVSNYNSPRPELLSSPSMSSSGYGGSAGTPESLSSADSPSFSFQASDDSPSTSRTSNHIEFTSMSENSNEQVIQSDCQSETSQSTELNDDR